MSLLNGFKRAIKSTGKSISSTIFRTPLSQKKFRVLVLNIHGLKYLFRGKYKYNESDFFDYKKNIQPKFIWERSYYLGNTFYCLEDMLNNYCSHKKPIKAAIEHGIYWGISGETTECVDSGFPAVITMSDFRRDRIKEISDIKSIAIGPLIHYAEGLTEDEIKQYKRNDKILLVVLTHSVEEVSLEYSIKETIDIINRFKIDHGFTKVIVCLYYADVNLGRDIKYKEAGFEVFSNGSKWDPFFMKRQKRVFQICDYVLTNSISTHIGYALYLGKPVTYFDQEIKLNGNMKDIEVRMHSRNLDRTVSDVEHLKPLFIGFSETITQEQLETVKTIWGFQSIKSPNELYDILTGLDDIFLRQKTTKHHSI